MSTASSKPERMSSLINVDEARETLDMLATAAYLLPEEGSAAPAR
ncbi:hypothetical protein GCM10009810_15910 [Nostocoides vanveenii]|uniref:Uncharacterized protein n=1 Tax=Nostocoides vanveenii TaxID=330835 RepID=A0ABN2KIN1_9MICO